MLSKLRGSIGPMESIIIDITERFQDLFENCERVFNSIHQSGKMRITSVEDFLKGPFVATKEELKRPRQAPPRDNRSEKREVRPLTSTR